ncbi:MAG: hypothetical protein ACLRY5_01680 [Zhenhengia sp.]
MSADKAKRNIYKGITYVLLIGIAILVAFPFLWMILSSFKDISEFYIMPPKLMPEAFKLDNYIELFGRGDFGRYYLNSILLQWFRCLETYLLFYLQPLHLQSMTLKVNMSFS